MLYVVYTVILIIFFFWLSYQEKRIQYLTDERKRIDENSRNNHDGIKELGLSNFRTGLFLQTYYKLLSDEDKKKADEIYIELLDKASNNSKELSNEENKTE